jgi:RND family efflux transporter MFP subunit
MRLALVVIICFGLTACGEAEKEIADTDTKPIAVQIANVGQSDSAQTIEAIGTVAWRAEIPLGFTTPGQIAAISVNEGDRVRRGQILARLDTTNVQADLSAANAEAVRARSDAARLETLYKQGWVTKQRYEAAVATAKSSAAAVSARAFARNTATVIAPHDGVVLLRTAEPRQVVTAGLPVVTIGDARRGMVIRVSATDRMASSVSKGALADVQFQALPGETVRGQVIEIGSRANPATGTFDVEIALPSDPRLRAGMIGSVKIAAIFVAGAGDVRIPATALLSPRAGEALVYVVEPQGVAKLRTVEIGDFGTDGVIIRKGLQSGERVAVSNLDRLSDGAKVTTAGASR